MTSVVGWHRALLLFWFLFNNVFIALCELVNISYYSCGA